MDNLDTASERHYRLPEANPPLLYGLPRAHFGAILLDPPWRYETWNKATAVKRSSGKGTNVSADVHYNTMRTADLAAMPVADVAARDCAMFLWITWPMLVEALRLIDIWGFKYKTCAFDWMKAHARQIDMLRDDADVQVGMGFWTRANTEVCLLATRGKPKRLNADVRMGIIEPRREHSRKPDCVHSRIERLVPGPYLELFGRQQRPGWTVRGDESDKFGATGAV